MRLASAIFPRYCVICGDSIDPFALYPLCASCVKSLPRISGTVCNSCGKPLVSEKERCMRCRVSSYGFNRVTAIFPYVDSVKTLISAYKTSERTSLAVFFASEIAEGIGKNHVGCSVVPVPPRPGKLRKKGWDQVDAIMKILSARHGIAIHGILRRIKSDVQQKTLNHDQRAQNIKGKFLYHSKFPSPSRVVLIDDVFTTGATLSECAAVLKAAGAVSVDAVCIAID